MLFAWLHRYPFFRLLGPLIVGIYCSDELIFQGQSGWVASCVFPLFFSRDIDAFFFSEMLFQTLDIRCCSFFLLLCFRFYEDELSNAGG